MLVLIFLLSSPVVAAIEDELDNNEDLGDVLDEPPFPLYVIFQCKGQTDILACQRASCKDGQTSDRWPSSCGEECQTWEARWWF